MMRIGMRLPEFNDKHTYLFNFRVGLGLSRERLCSILGISSLSIARWETGGSKPKPENKNKWVQALRQYALTHAKDLYVGKEQVSEDPQGVGDPEGTSKTHGGIGKRP